MWLINCEQKICIKCIADKKKSHVMCFCFPIMSYLLLDILKGSKSLQIIVFSFKEFMYI